MLREGASDEQTFQTLEGVCAAADDGHGGVWFCSRSCELLGRHVLIFPNPRETYDDALDRARRAPADAAVRLTHRRRAMSRLILVHLNIELPDDDSRTVEQVQQAVEGAIEVGSEALAGLEIVVALAEEV